MNARTTVIRRLLSVALLTLVLLLATSCGGNKKKTTTSSASSFPIPTGKTSTSPVPTPTPKPSSRKGAKGLTIRTVSGTHNLYPLITGKSLASYIGGQAEGPNVRVVSVAAADAFWIGKGANQRVLVKIRLKGRPTPKIHAGQKVGIIGQLTANPPGAAKALGVKSAADKSMLSRQGAYLLVSIGDLKLH